eukprot:CAMPEP_0202860088 /NCGR_PEP_ID=MMETSP1391-20130828/1949_1 /ASSEMBLY_ACC=CAM_ASM_000867 /TAXON_ID=1034604 /ORGANISM="Chlamydomonas leiostraca, Strain SAG 11-49" /LENGTH=105 /DNA_ID=CAMNT_0049539223 /DNA_START=164 /DNA_END=477 /DNA_ORIENTATION=+
MPSSSIQSPVPVSALRPHHAPGGQQQQGHVPSACSHNRQPAHMLHPHTALHPEHQHARPTPNQTNAPAKNTLPAHLYLYTRARTREHHKPWRPHSASMLADTAIT